MFDAETHECLYVGQSRQPNKREAQHRNKAEFRDLAPWFMVILESTMGDESASALEHIWIQLMWDLGEARHNKRKGNVKTSKEVLVYYECVETGEKFGSLSHVGRAFGWTAGTITNHVKSSVDENGVFLVTRYASQLEDEKDFHIRDLTGFYRELWRKREPIPEEVLEEDLIDCPC